MVDWRTIKKIDAHIHILPDTVHEANPDSKDVWAYADLHEYRKIMERYHIERAVIMPLNDPWLMSMEFTVDAVHKNLRDMKQCCPGKFYAMADVDVRNSPQESVKAICRAIDDGLDGIKLHPNNSGVALDSDYNRDIFAFAQERKAVVVIHSYPNAEDDPCAADRVVNILNAFPALNVIVAHMGGFQWEKLLPTGAMVDISAILPDYVRTYGIGKTNEILCQFGPDRLIFATDYPDNRHLKPEEIYETYFDILNQMDFSAEEAEKIAYKNILRVLGHDNPLSIQTITSYAQCSAFVSSFYGDPIFSDPMLPNEEEAQSKIITPIERTDRHCVLGVYRGSELAGLFSFLTLKDEQYLEMLVGLSRDAEVYSEVIAYLEQHYPAYEADFVFNPNNYLLKEILSRKGAEFEPEQQKMVLTRPMPPVDTTGVELLSEQYKQQYFAIHNRDMYWTGEKVAAAADRFRAFLAIEEGKVVGYLDVTYSFEENEPFDLMVLESHRRKGWGRRLLAKALELNKPKGMMLLVEADNTPAIRLYESMGFEKAPNQNYLTAFWKVPY